MSVPLEISWRCRDEMRPEPEEAVRRAASRRGAVEDKSKSSRLGIRFVRRREDTSESLFLRERWREPGWMASSSQPVNPQSALHLAPRVLD